MFNRKPTPYDNEPPNRTVGESLEAFCQGLVQSHRYDPSILTPEKVAQEFRYHFRVPVDPVASAYVMRLVQSFDIEVVGMRSLPDADAMWLYSKVANRYEIHMPYDGKEEPISLLHELFEIIYWRCYYYNKFWAKEWLLMQGVSQPHQVADRFAFAIVLPRHTFREQARQHGYDILALANHFGLSPASILLAFNFLLSFPCPILIVRLGFRDLPQPDQMAFRFDPEGKHQSVPALVWDRRLKSGIGQSQRSWLPLELLGRKCPHKRALVDVDGFAYQAIKEARSLQATTDTILGIKLPGEVFAVARPNGIYRSQLFLYVVPVGYEDVLLDDVLRAQAEEAAPFRRGFSSS